MAVGKMHTNDSSQNIASNVSIQQGGGPLKVILKCFRVFEFFGSSKSSTGVTSILVMYGEILCSGHQLSDILSFLEWLQLILRVVKGEGVYSI